MNSPLLDAIVEPSRGTDSHAFKATSVDGARWRVKAVTPLRPRIPVTDLIVGMAGRLIGAPVAAVAALEVPAEFEGESYGGDYPLARGFVFGSREVPEALDGRRPLRYRDLDDNRRRHAGMFALHDWCWGDDPQWLYAGAEDFATHSIDHGYYLPGRPVWTAADLRSCVEEPHVAPWAWAGLDGDALDGYADRLEVLTHSELCAMLNEVPSQWPVTRHELATVGWFLERRAGPVADRLRRMAMNVSEGGQGR